MSKGCPHTTPLREQLYAVVSEAEFSGYGYGAEELARQVAEDVLEALVDVLEFHGVIPPREAPQKETKDV